MNMLNLTCSLDNLQLETEDAFLKLSQNVNHFSENKQNTETVGLTNTSACYRDSNRDYCRKLGRDNHQLFGIAK